jgi:hypothetical protein
MQQMLGLATRIQEDSEVGICYSNTLFNNFTRKETNFLYMLLVYVVHTNLQQRSHAVSMEYTVLALRHDPP